MARRRIRSSERIGKTHGYLRVEEVVDGRRVRCTCLRCGNSGHIALLSNVTSGTVVSCGCLMRDNAAKMGRAWRGRGRVLGTRGGKKSGLPTKHTEVRKPHAGSMTQKILAAVKASPQGLTRRGIAESIGSDLTKESMTNILCSLVRRGRLRRDGEVFSIEVGTMARYQIENNASGVVLGTWQADSEAEALDAMARDAGYDSQSDALKTTGSDGSDLVVTRVDRASNGRVSLDNGQSTERVREISDADVAKILQHIEAGYCDEELAEELHTDLAVSDPTPADNRAWVDAYAQRHEDKHGEVWTIG